MSPSLEKVQPDAVPFAEFSAVLAQGQRDPVLRVSEGHVPEGSLTAAESDAQFFMAFNGESWGEHDAPIGVIEVVPGDDEPARIEFEAHGKLAEDAKLAYGFLQVALERAGVEVVVFDPETDTNLSEKFVRRLGATAAKNVAPDSGLLEIQAAA